MRELIVDAVPQLSARWTARLDARPATIVPAPDDRHAALPLDDGSIAVVALGDGAVVTRFPAHAGPARDVAWFDLASLVSCGEDGTARTWHVDGTAIASVEAGASWVERVAVAPVRPKEAPVFATAAGRIVQAWTRDGSHVAAWPKRASTVLDAAWRPAGAGGPLLAAVAYGGVSLFETHRPHAVRELAWTGSSVVLAWSPDGRFIATGDQDASVHFWNVRSGGDLMMSGYPRKVRELAWRADGKRLATGGGPEVCIWNTTGSPEGTRPLQLEFHDVPISAIGYVGSSMALMSADEDGVVALWQPGIEKQPIAIDETHGGATVLRASGAKMLAAGADGSVRLYDADAIGAPG